MYIYYFVQQCEQWQTPLLIMLWPKEIILSSLYYVYMLTCERESRVFAGKKGQYVWTEGRDEESISRGVYNTYTAKNLRYSQVRTFRQFYSLMES